MELTLSADEHEFLLNILEQRERELLREIAQTDRRVFKQELRKDEKLLDSIVCRLRITAAQETRG